LNLSTAIILGIVQGLTELFPVSSSAHLVILQSFLPDFHQPGVAFDTTLHLGTLLAVAFYFRADIRNMINAVACREHELADKTCHEDTFLLRKLVIFLIIGTIPAVILGILFIDYIHDVFESATIAAFFLIITGFLLFFSDRVKNAGRDEKDLNLTDSVLIGLAQSVALLPGISRSGATITAGIFRKLNRTTSAKYSFLLSLPTVFGAVIFEVCHFNQVPSGEVWLYIIGAICAAIAGFISLKLFFIIIREARLKYFAYYCWILGTFTLLVKSSFF
jgi:undecaprenyl-diphosphatase